MSKTKNTLFALTLVALAGISYYAFNKDDIDNAVANSVQPNPVVSPIIPASGNLDLDKITGTDVVENSYILIKKGIKKDTAVLIYNHPNTCCPGNVQSYSLLDEKFTPLRVEGKVTSCPPSFKTEYDAAIRQIDSLETVITGLGGSVISKSLDDDCGTIYGLSNAKMNKN